MGSEYLENGKHFQDFKFRIRWIWWVAGRWLSKSHKRLDKYLSSNSGMAAIALSKEWQYRMDPAFGSQASRMLHVAKDCRDDYKGDNWPDCSGPSSPTPFMVLVSKLRKSKHLGRIQRIIRGHPNSKSHSHIESIYKSQTADMCTHKHNGAHSSGIRMATLKHRFGMTSRELST